MICVAPSYLEQCKNCAAAKIFDHYQNLVNAGEDDVTAMIQAEYEAEEETDRVLEEMERQGIQGIWWDDYEEKTPTYQLCLFDFIPAGLLEYYDE